MDDNLPGKTRWETEQYRRSCGKHAAQAQAFMRLGLLMEYDEDSPAPMSMMTSLVDGAVFETLWGCAALPSAGDEKGCAAVDRFAAKHYVTAGWEEGRYRAVMDLGGGYRYGAFYLPERNLHPAVPASREPELAAAS